MYIFIYIQLIFIHFFLFLIILFCFALLQFFLFSSSINFSLFTCLIIFSYPKILSYLPLLFFFNSYFFSLIFLYSSYHFIYISTFQIFVIFNFFILTRCRISRTDIINFLSWNLFINNDIICKFIRNDS